VGVKDKIDGESIEAMGELKRGFAPGGNPPESLFTKGGRTSPFVKGRARGILARG